MAGGGSRAPDQRQGLGTYFRDEIAGPLEADAYIGFNASLYPRVADTISAPPPTPGKPNVFAEMLKDPRVGERQSYQQSGQSDAADDHQLVRLAGPRRFQQQTAMRMRERSHAFMGRSRAAAKLTASGF